MAKIIAFDSATSACSAALYNDGEIHYEFEVAPRRHNERLLVMIDSLLKAAKLCIGDCDAIAFGCGPGSFMGLRIAAGLAQGLAFAADVPVIAISSLKALAQMAFEQTHQKLILTGLDARMDQIYWGLYRYESAGLQAVVADRLSTPAHIIIELQSSDVSAYDYQQSILAGNAWQAYAELLPLEIKQLAHSVTVDYPDASAVALLAFDELTKGNTISPAQIELSYIRNVVAQKRFGGKENC